MKNRLLERNKEVVVANSENSQYLTPERCPDLNTTGLRLSIIYLINDDGATKTMDTTVKRISGEHIYLDFNGQHVFIAWINGLYYPSKLVLFQEEHHYIVKDIIVL